MSLKFYGILLIGIFTISLTQVMTTNPNSSNQSAAKNVLGGDLVSCCNDPMTGFHRDGYCHTGATDYGVHTVCAVMTKDFLSYTGSCGNDLSSPNPRSHFPGLQPGDKWCLCASRWLDAHKAGFAPPVKLEATHERTLDIVPLEILEKYKAPKARS